VGFGIEPGLHCSVGGRVYDPAVAEIVDLAEFRERIERDPVRRLERAIARLDPLVKGGTGRIGRVVETELLAITGAVTAGLPEQAAARAERLADRLEHPASRAAN
jgi:hypothetical protein